MLRSLQVLFGCRVLMFRRCFHDVIVVVPTVVVVENISRTCSSMNSEKKSFVRLHKRKET